MSAIEVQYKRRLSEIIGIGHSKFGKVAHRRAYRDDDDEGGGAGSDLRFDSHPLFANLPDGADSDLSTISNNSEHSEDAAKERVMEASPELKKQPALQAEMTPGFSPTPDQPG